MKNFSMVAIVLLFNIFLASDMFCCSLIKITARGKTIVGNNEDFSNPDTRIWFEQGNGKQFGAVYVGYNELSPEGGINEAGLMFDAFGVDSKPLHDTTGKLPIFEFNLKKRIMKECSTVKQVKTLIDKYNLYFWSHSVWVFIDKSGNYLVVDSDLSAIGNNQYFVQTNFRQSEIKNEKGITDSRYLKAVAILKSHCKANAQYCAALMDSVHQETTLYTTVYDLNSGTIDLYNYHNYTKVIRFNIKDELKKGNRILCIPDLFPEVINPAYKGMLNLKATFDSLAFHFTPNDSARRLAVIDDLRKHEWAIHVMMNSGYEYLRQGYIQKAIGMFSQVKELYPKMPHGYHLLGEAYMENKQYDLALLNYSHSIELYPADIEGKQRIAILNELVKK
jgi:tetratricopeptide (TPR) repeat protein